VASNGQFVTPNGLMQNTSKSCSILTSQPLEQPQYHQQF